MIGSIGLYARSIIFLDKEILLGGIGGVCTHRNFRKRGIAKKMLEKSAKLLKDKNCDIALLATDINKLGKLYESIGFVPLNRKFVVTGKSGKKYYDEGGMIAPVASMEKFNLVLNSQEVFNIQGQDW